VTRPPQRRRRMIRPSRSCPRRTPAPTTRAARWPMKSRETRPTRSVPPDPTPPGGRSPPGSPTTVSPRRWPTAPPRAGRTGCQHPRRAPPAPPRRRGRVSRAAPPVAGVRLRLHGRRRAPRAVLPRAESAVRLAEVRVVPARASRHRVEPEDEAGRSPRRGAGGAARGRDAPVRADLVDGPDGEASVCETSPAAEAPRGRGAAFERGGADGLRQAGAAS